MSSYVATASDLFAEIDEVLEVGAREARQQEAAAAALLEENDETDLGHPQGDTLRRIATSEVARRGRRMLRRNLRRFRKRAKHAALVTTRFCLQSYDAALTAIDERMVFLQAELSTLRDANDAANNLIEEASQEGETSEAGTSSRSSAARERGVRFAHQGPADPASSALQETPGNEASVPKLTRSLGLKIRRSAAVVDRGALQRAQEERLGRLHAIVDGPALQKHLSRTQSQNSAVRRGAPSAASGSSSDPAVVTQSSKLMGLSSGGAERAASLRRGAVRALDRAKSLGNDRAGSRGSVEVPLATAGSAMPLTTRGSLADIGVDPRVLDRARALLRITRGSTSGAGASAPKTGEPGAATDVPQQLPPQRSQRTRFAPDTRILTPVEPYEFDVDTSAVDLEAHEPEVDVGEAGVEAEAGALPTTEEIKVDMLNIEEQMWIIESAVVNLDRLWGAFECALHAAHTFAHLLLGMIREEARIREVSRAGTTSPSLGARLTRGIDVEVATELMMDVLVEESVEAKEELVGRLESEVRAVEDVVLESVSSCADAEQELLADLEDVMLDMPGDVRGKRTELVSWRAPLRERGVSLRTPGGVHADNVDDVLALAAKSITARRAKSRSAASTLASVDRSANSMPAWRRPQAFAAAPATATAADRRHGTSASSEGPSVGARRRRSGRARSDIENWQENKHRTSTLSYSERSGELRPRIQRQHVASVIVSGVVAIAQGKFGKDGAAIEMAARQASAVERGASAMEEGGSGPLVGRRWSSKKDLRTASKRASGSRLHYSDAISSNEFGAVREPSAPAPISKTLRTASLAPRRQAGELAPAKGRTRGALTGEERLSVERGSLSLTSVRGAYAGRLDRAADALDERLAAWRGTAQRFLGDEADSVAGRQGAKPTGLVDRKLTHSATVPTRRPESFAARNAGVSTPAIVDERLGTTPAMARSCTIGRTPQARQAGPKQGSRYQRYLTQKTSQRA
ncbi:unnamed protein product [Pedinophyceae sp. YPF-701]|nr:unnamed protein product [Pedinophyceae sp. YPF-701]